MAFSNEIHLISPIIRTCPPGPGLLAKVNSTTERGKEMALNWSAQFRADLLSSSVDKLLSAGGIGIFGRPLYTRLSDGFEDKGKLRTLEPNRGKFKNGFRISRIMLCLLVTKR